MPHQENKKSGKGKRIFFISIGVILALTAVFLLILYIAGSSKIEEQVPSEGIIAVNVPFSGNGQETIPVQWIVKGAEEEEALISGVYFGSMPSQADFTKAPLPDQVKKSFIPFYEVILDNKQKVLQADVPNLYPVIYVNIYAQIKDRHYWSQEFMIKSQ